QRLLDGARRHQVEDVDLARLAHAGEAADPLLDAHRVPRQVVVDETVSELEVAPLAAGLGGDEYPARPLEGPYRVLLLAPAQAAVIESEGLAGVAQDARQVLLRRAVPREDEQLVGPPAKEVQERAALGVVGDRPGLGQE